MYYYKVFELDSDSVLGVITTNDFREYINGKMYIPMELKNTNVFSFGDSYYRAPWMKFIPGKENEYQTLDAFLISKEEYLDFLNPKMEEENLNENN